MSEARDTAMYANDPETAIWRVLSDELRAAAYEANGEFAWSAERACEVIAALRIHGVAVLGVEVWLPTHPGPTIPTPRIYQWDAGARRTGETWLEYVRRVNQEATAYVVSFGWAEADAGLAEPWFNLSAQNEG